MTATHWSFNIREVGKDVDASTAPGWAKAGGKERFVMPVRVAINGFGRVGRCLVRACFGHEEVDIIAINVGAKSDTRPSC